MACTLAASSALAWQLIPFSTQWHPYQLTLTVCLQCTGLPPVHSYTHAAPPENVRSKMWHRTS